MKILSKILVLLLTAGVSSSCLSHLKYDKTTGEIRLRPVVGLGTRSGEDFIPFPEDREFRVTAVSRDSGEKYLDDVIVKSRGARGWVPENSPQWPYDQSLTFAGYYPTDLQVTCDRECNLKIDSYTVEGKGIDILLAETDRAYTKNDSIVGFPFRHALTKMDFRVKQTLNLETRVKIQKIELCGIFRQGSYDSSASPDWRSSGQKSDLTIFEADGEGVEVYKMSPSYLGGSWFVLPQDGGASIRVTFALSTAGSEWLGNQTVETPAVLKEWLSDRHYTYTLNIQEPGPEDTTGDPFVLKYTTGISSWDERLSD